jgi:hypothetical protein
MGTTIIETLYSAGQALSGAFMRIVGAQDSSGNAQALRFRGGLANGLQVAVVGDNGQDVDVSPLGDVRVAQLTRIAGGSFNTGVATLDTTKWTTTLANGGTANQLTAGYLQVATNTTANGSAIISTSRPGRFLSDVTAEYFGTIGLTNTGVANNVRRWGAFDSNNGVFFALNGTTFQVVTRLNGVDTAISGGSFNGALGTAGPTLDTNLHRWVIFAVDAGYLEFRYDDEVVHIIENPAVPLFAGTSKTIRAETTNSAGITSNNGLNITGMGLNRVAQGPVKPEYFRVAPAGGVAVTQTLKLGAGTLHRIMITSTSSTAGTFVTVYDNTAASGTIIDVLDTTAVQIYDYGREGIDFYTGLTINYPAVTKPGSVTVIWD